MEVKHRRSGILRDIQEASSIGVKELAQRYSVSEMTVRRDLAFLDKNGLIVRTHGGGTVGGSLKFLANALPHFARSEIKMAIGKLAASLVLPGQTVMVDSGTTALEVARHLPTNTGIRLVTTSLCVAQEMFGSPIEVILPGGTLRQDFPGVYGQLTESNLANFQINVLFVGCDSADSRNGFYMSSMEQSGLHGAMIRSADRVVLVTESVKFDHRSFVRFAFPSDIQTLVSDAGLSESNRHSLEKQGVEVLIADVRGND